MQSALRTQAGFLAEDRCNKREATILERYSKQVATVIWDFTRDGGAIGDVSFNTQLPANAVVTGIYTDEQTVVTGATSITLKAGSTSLTGALDLTADTGVNSRALASGTAIKLASASELKITIATAAATAGKVRFAVEFYVSP